MPATTGHAEARGVLEALGSSLRPELAELASYVPHVPEGIVAKLDANEAPPSLSAEVREAVVRGVSRVALERYPDPRATRLREAIAARTGARAEDLLVGTGSDEVIGLVLNALSAPRGRNAQPTVLYPTPTFVMYRITARAHGQKPIEVPLDASWDLDVRSMNRALELMTPNVVFVASPNNPTGNRVSADRLEAVTAAATSSFVVLDEAYVDYAEGGSLRSMRARHPHVGVLRTLSKVGLAALRIGWLEADAGLLAEIDKGRQPFNTSALAQAAAAEVLETAWDAVQRDVAEIVRRRGELAASLRALDGIEVTEPDANFVWIATRRPAADVHAALVEDGILVRSFHSGGGRLANRLRITIGTDAEHERLVAALERASRGGA